MLCKTADNIKTKKPPAYQRIEEDIRSKVRDGRLPAGTMLSSRHNLAREYGVALSTAQQAVANLIADGILETFDRRGTFVTQPRAETEVGKESDFPTSTQTLSERRAAESGLRAAQNVVLVPQTSAMLGIVTTARIDPTEPPDVGSLWARLAIRSLEQVFSAEGGTTHFFDRYPESQGPYPRGLNDANAISLPDAIRALQAQGVDALAVVGLCDARDMSDEVMSVVDVEQMPTVYLSWHEIPPPLSQVFYDNRFAGYQAAQHLLRCGCLPLIVLAPFSDTWITERIEGARDAVRHAGLPLDTLRVYPAEQGEIYDRHQSSITIETAAQALFAEGLSETASVKPVGIIGPNDQIAYAVLQAGAEQGKTAGQDFGLVGFDDDAQSCRIGLTTVRPPVEAMGEEAGRLLLRALRGEKKGQLMRLRSHLIPRASTFLRTKST